MASGWEVSRMCRGIGWSMLPAKVNTENQYPRKNSSSPQKPEVAIRGNPIKSYRQPSYTFYNRFTCQGWAIVRVKTIVLAISPRKSRMPLECRQASHHRSLRLASVRSVPWT